MQVTGEALYTDDVPLPPNTLHAALVKSTRPHAKITSVDPSAQSHLVKHKQSAGLSIGSCLNKSLPAMQMEGVVAYFDHTSVPGSNDIGAVIHDEEVFASEKVTCIGVNRVMQAFQGVQLLPASLQSASYAI